MLNSHGILPSFVLTEILCENYCPNERRLTCNVRNSIVTLPKALSELFPLLCVRRPSTFIQRSSPLKPLVQLEPELNKQPTAITKNVNKQTFVSETTESVGTKPRRNDPEIVPYHIIIKHPLRLIDMAAKDRYGKLS